MSQSLNTGEDVKVASVKERARVCCVLEDANNNEPAPAKCFIITSCLLPAALSTTFLLMIKQCSDLPKPGSCDAT
jgi:hypothetical protein